MRRGMLWLSGVLLFAASATDAPMPPLLLDFELPVRFSYTALDPALGTDFRTTLPIAAALRKEMTAAFKAAAPAPELTPVEATFSDGVTRNITELTYADTYLHEGSLMRFAGHPVPVDQMVRAAFTGLYHYIGYEKVVPPRRLADAVDVASTLLMDAGQYHWAVWGYSHAPVDAWSGGHRVRFAEACIRSGYPKLGLATLAALFDEWEARGHFNAWWEAAIAQETDPTAVEEMRFLSSLSLRGLIADLLRVLYEEQEAKPLNSTGPAASPQPLPTSPDVVPAFVGWDARHAALNVISQRWSGQDPAHVMLVLKHLLLVAAFSDEQHYPDRLFYDAMGAHALPVRGQGARSGASSGTKGQKEAKPTAASSTGADASTPGEGGATVTAAQPEPLSSPHASSTSSSTSFSSPTSPPEGFITACELAVWALRSMGAAESADMVAAVALRLHTAHQLGFGAHSLGLFIASGAPFPIALHALGAGDSGSPVPSTPTVAFDTLFRHYHLLMRGVGRKDDRLLNAHMDLWRTFMLGAGEADATDTPTQRAGRQSGDVNGAEGALPDAQAGAAGASSSAGGSDHGNEPSWVEKLRDYALKVSKAFGDSHPESVLIAADSWRAALSDAHAARWNAGVAAKNSSHAAARSVSTGGKGGAATAPPQLPALVRKQLRRGVPISMHSLNQGFDTSFIALGLSAAHAFRGVEPSAAYRLEDEAVRAAGGHLLGRVGGDAYLPLAAHAFTYFQIGVVSSHSSSAAAIRVVRVCRGDLMSVPLDQIVSGSFRGPHGSALLRWCHPDLVRNATLTPSLGHDLSWVSSAASRHMSPRLSPFVKDIAFRLETYAPSTLSSLWVLALSVDSVESVAISGFGADVEALWRKAAAVEQMPYYLAQERAAAKAAAASSGQAVDEAAVEEKAWAAAAARVRPPWSEAMYRHLLASNAAAELTRQAGRRAAVHHFAGALYALVAQPTWKYRHLPYAVGVDTPLARASVTGYDTTLPAGLAPSCYRDLETGPAWVWSGEDPTNSLAAFNITAAANKPSSTAADGGAVGRALQALAPFTMWGTCNTPRGLPNVPTPGSLFTGAAMALLPPDSGDSEYGPWQKTCFFTHNVVFEVPSPITVQTMQWTSSASCLRWLLEDVSSVRDGIRVALWNAMPGAAAGAAATAATAAATPAPDPLRPGSAVQKPLPGTGNWLLQPINASELLSAQRASPGATHPVAPSVACGVRCVSGPLFDAYSLYQGLRQRLAGFKVTLQALKNATGNETLPRGADDDEGSANATSASPVPNAVAVAIAPRIAALEATIAAADAAALAAARLVRSAWVTLYLAGAGGGGDPETTLAESGHPAAAALLRRLNQGWAGSPASEESGWGVTDAEAATLPGPAALRLRRGDVRQVPLPATKTRRLLRPRWKELEAMAATAEHEAVAQEKARRQHKVTTVAIEGSGVGEDAGGKKKEAPVEGVASGGAAVAARAAAAGRRRRAAAARPDGSGIFHPDLLGHLTATNALRLDGAPVVEEPKQEGGSGETLAVPGRRVKAGKAGGAKGSKGGATQGVSVGVGGDATEQLSNAGKEDTLQHATAGETDSAPPASLIQRRRGDAAATA